MVGPGVLAFYDQESIEVQQRVGQQGLAAQPLELLGGLEEPLQVGRLAVSSRHIRHGLLYPCDLPKILRPLGVSRPIGCGQVLHGPSQ